MCAKMNLSMEEMHIAIIIIAPNPTDMATVNASKYCMLYSGSIITVVFLCFSCQCVPDYNNCDVFVTKTKTEYDCCDGYTTIPVSQGYNTPNSWYTLKTDGCPIG